ncbi:MAG: penicillin-binding protein 2 [Lautropia sp.]|nr:MAG: penicillin-binding protein 2 [Pseudomonadota bacterium]MBC6959907.1 penicillin-binding protein 2 [Lautropia sp.]MCL4700768.1 penicillin-binding protein 2 [Burkholderiaceae bacterium]MCZ2415340.1 penicillin-binding protein 2 [Burkholderiales bacterium]MDL1908444.1 penicillin-binding protein 2 [Betaproteobacteria bacterium PRO1]
MVEVRDTELDLYRLRLRLAIAMALVIVCFGLLVGRFVYLQVYRYADFHAQAEDNRIALVPAPPVRGLIFDRNGVLLAENVSAYTLELSPRRAAGLDDTIAALSGIVEITPRDRQRFRRLLEDSRSADSVPLKVRLTDEEVARLAANRFRFPGVEISARLFRNYPLGETAAHVVGYIGRISPDDKRRLDEQELLSNYAGSTHIGKVGVEASYESALHGHVGFDEVEVSAGGRIVRRLSRKPPVPGSNLVLSIDIRLQRLAEQLYGERRGALVAIEPKTGDVLAFVSRPSFDPNLFVDGIDTQTWQALNEDPDAPLMNRPLRGTYPPGSTYKPFMALAALMSGVRTPQDTISDPGYFQLGNHRFRDSRPSGHGTVDLRKSIVVSSDTYYYKVAYDMGVDRIHDFMKPWGFGQLTGIDLEHENAGVLPSSQWKLKRFRQKWFPGETPSIGIGQGYNSFTILQLAHATATLANDGIVMRPHLVQAIEDPVTHEKRRTVRSESYRIDLRRDYLDLVKSALVDVTRFGTGRVAFANAGYVAAGKTGTAQVIGIKQGERYDARRIAERHRDHSLFMAFAPVENPKIAVAIIVENGGFGAQAAAPIARKLFDFHLLGKLPSDVPGELLPRPIDEAELRDVPESVEPEQVAEPEPKQ